MNSSNEVQRTRAFMERVLAEAIHPNADAVAGIIVTGGVAVVMFEPGNLAKEAARTLGWDGTSLVFELRREDYWRVSWTDSVCAAWLRRPGTEVGRIFLIAHEGNLLINFAPDRGYWIEPGSTDGARAPGGTQGNRKTRRGRQRAPG